MPTLTMVCGPNGGGKSTLTRILDMQERSIVIDPDRLALENGLSPIEAGKEAARRARECIRNGQSFARESTLSGNFDLQIAKKAKEQGFHLELIYSGLNSPETAIARVKERVANGGHDVPESDIQRRYHRSLKNLPQIIELVDRVMIYDNTDKQSKLVLVHEKGNPLNLTNAPEWLAFALRFEKKPPAPGA